jgi:sigma-B regulation protein RsbU (phosphoserine phosphatase)
MANRFVNVTVKTLVVFLLVVTPVTMAITIAGSFDYAWNGSGGLVVRPAKHAAGELVVVEVIPETAAQELGLRRGDVVVALDGHPSPAADDVNFGPAGSSHRLTIRRGESMWHVRLPYRNLFDHINLGAMPWVVAQIAALIFYFVGLVVSVKSRQRMGTLLTFTCCFLALAFNGSLVTRLPALSDFPLFQSFLIAGRETPIFAAIAVSLTVHFASVFPRPKKILIRHRLLPVLFYIPVPLMVAVNLLFIHRWSFSTLIVTQLGILSGGVIFTIFLLLHSVRTAREERVRLQAQVLFWGTFFGLMPHVACLVLSRFVSLGESWPLLINLTVLLFPLSFAYVVLKNRFLGVQLLLTGGAKYALVSRVADLGFVLLAIGLAGRPLYLIGRDGPKTSTIVFLIVGIGIMVALVSVRQWVGKVIEERFFRRVYDARRTLRELAQMALTVLELRQLLRLVVQGVAQAFRLDRAAVLIREDDRFVVRGATGFAAAMEDTVSFPVDGRVARLLEDHPEGVRLYLDDPACKVCSGIGKKPEELEAVRRLGANLLTPLRSGQGLMGFLSLGPKPAREAFTRGEMGLLSAAAVQIGVAVANANLTHEIAAREQHRREIEKARDLQMALLPRGDPALPGLELAGRCKPAAEVAGDYFDFLALEDGRVAVILGDVTGHGLEAGMMAAVAKAALGTQVAARPELPEMLAAIDRAMRWSTHQTIFMTAVLVLLDPDRRRLEYGIAGHPPPLLLPEDGPPIPLKGGSYPLGIESDQPYVTLSRAVRPGDSLLLYSDGILESQNAVGECFGLERLTAVFAATRGQPAETTRDAVLKALDRFTGRTPKKDDVTVVVVRVAALDPATPAGAEDEPNGVAEEPSAGRAKTSA